MVRIKSPKVCVFQPSCGCVQGRFGAVLYLPACPPSFPPHLPQSPTASRAGLVPLPPEQSSAQDPCPAQSQEGFKIKVPSLCASLNCVRSILPPSISPSCDTVPEGQTIAQGGSKRAEPWRPGCLVPALPRGAG